MHRATTYSLSLLLLLALCGPTPALADAPAANPDKPKKDMLAMYRGMTGTWTTKGIGYATDVIKKPYNYDETSVIRELFDGQIIERRTLGKASDGKTYASIWLCTYDKFNNTYVGWSHNTSGIHAKSIGTWSEKTRTMTWKLAYPKEHGVKFVCYEDLSVPGKISLDFKVDTLDASKKIARHQNVTTQTKRLKKSQADKAIKKMQAKGQKLDDKLAMFKDYTGPWRSEVWGKATDIHKLPYKSVADWTGRHVLSGTMFQFTGTVKPQNGTSYDYIWLYTYDPREKTYAVWYHESSGFNMKQYAKWDPKTRELSYRFDPKEKLIWKVIDCVMQLKDKNTMVGRVKVNDKNGKTWFDEELIAKPRKGEQ